MLLVDSAIRRFAVLSISKQFMLQFMNFSSVQFRYELWAYNMSYGIFYVAICLPSLRKVLFQTLIGGYIYTIHDIISSTIHIKMYLVQFEIRIQYPNWISANTPTLASSVPKSECTCIYVNALIFFHEYIIQAHSSELNDIRNLFLLSFTLYSSVSKERNHDKWLVAFYQQTAFAPVRETRNGSWKSNVCYYFF